MTDCHGHDLRFGLLGDRGVRPIIYGSICSGIESASVAWHPLGWRCAFMSEIDAFARAVLKHHFPETPLHGDFQTIQEGDYEPIDLLVGGTPCQDFSVAGLRAGMAGDRGSLTLEYLALAGRLRPRWLVFENVPGILSSDGGRGFGAFLWRLGQLGYGWAYRTLDAQHFGVPQRRRRVFVVGYLGDWRRAAAVLFERRSLSWDTAPRRETGEGVAGTLGTDLDRHGTGQQARSGQLVDIAEVSKCLSASHTASGRLDPSAETFVAHPLRAQAQASHRADSETYVTHSLRGEGFDASEDGTGRGVPLVAVNFALRGRDGGAMPEIGDGQISALRSASGGSTRDYVTFDTTQITSVANRSNPQVGDPCHPLASGAHAPSSAGQAGVRRLTPLECERLQGFPDGWTRIPRKHFKSTPKSKRFLSGLYDDQFERNADGSWTQFAEDGPRYKALGNSKAVPVVRWIGERIALVDAFAK